MSYKHAKNAGRSRIGIQLTGDHEVLTERGYVPVESLEADDRIAVGQGLSPLAFDVVCGTLLGDASINGQSAYLSFSHSAHQQEYAEFKADLLSEISPRVDELSVAAVAGGERRHQVVQVRTLAHRAIGLLRRDYYHDGRRCVPAWMAERLNARMLAFWFMDDGHMRIRPNRRPRAEIATCGFPVEEVEVLRRGLNRLGLEAKILRGRLHFDVCFTRSLAEIIAPYVPPAMRFKLPPDIALQIPFNPGLMECGPPDVFYDEVVVEEITDQYRSDKTFFCIDVEENHNFVTSGGVVHNCRPPGNRDPHPDEARNCRPFLDAQIDLIRPRIIVALGRIAAQNLLATDTPIGKMRGRVWEHKGIPVVVTYHPAYLLRSPTEKRRVWDDLLLARRVRADGG